MTWYVYILWTNNDQFYSCVTTDLDRAVSDQNNMKRKSADICWKNRPVTLVWYEERKDRRDANKRWAQIREMDREQIVELLRELPIQTKLELLRKRSATLDSLTNVDPDPPGQFKKNYSSRRSIGFYLDPRRRWYKKRPDVIPPLDQIVEKVRATPITKNCSPKELARHRVMLASEVRALLLKHGLKRGWEMARAIYNQPAIGMSFLDRDLTDEELIVLKDSLGFEFDRRGRLKGSTELLGE